MSRRVVTALVGGLLATIAITGCTTPIDAGATGTSTSSATPLESVEVGGVSRGYLLRAPDDAEDRDPMPVVVMIHGAGGNGERAETATGLTAIAETNGFIAAYPYGTQAANIPGEFSWNAGACCGIPARSGIDDVAFISAMLDEISATYPVDPEQIYVGGFSNGGMLSYRLACELGDRIAGIAVVSGALNVPDCDAPSAMDVLVIHGTADLVVPYAGGETAERTAARFGAWTNTSVADSVAFWRDRDGCDRRPSSVTEESVTTETYLGCDGGRRVEVVTISDGGHEWPRPTNLAYDATSEILGFFDLV